MFWINLLEVILDPKYKNAGKEINGSKALEKFSYNACDGGHQKYSLHVISPLQQHNFQIIDFQDTFCLYNYVFIQSRVLQTGEALILYLSVKAII